MRRKTGIVIAVAALAAGAVAVGAGAVVATTDDDGTETPITGDALDRATDAALEHIGEGRVTETEVGDEEGFYEVEVTRDDGSQVDVHLTEDFAVIGAQDDGTDDGTDDEGDGDDE